MFKAGQKAKTKLGETVQIIVALDTPDDEGNKFVGITASRDGSRQLMMWKSGGRFLSSGKPSCLDLEAAPVIETMQVYGRIDPDYNWIAWYANQEHTMCWGSTKDDAISLLRDTYPTEAEAA